MQRIPERDWKVFKRQHLELHDSYIERTLSRANEILRSEDLSSIEIFGQLAEFVRSARKEEQELFGDYRRSTAAFHVRRWYAEELMTESQIAEYSDEVRTFLSL